MDKISDFSQLNHEIMSCFKPKMRTNSTISADKMKTLISKGVLFRERYDGGLLLLEQRQTDYLLRFYLTDCEIQPPALPQNLTVEIVCRPGESDVPAAWWTQLGFVRKMKRLRMVQPPQTVQELLPPGDVPAEDVRALLEACFDAQTGCLPTEAELTCAIREGRLLSRFSGGKLCAVLHAEAAKGAVELRHLAVLRAYRGNGYANSLTEEFVHRFGDQRLRLWVREDLPQAQHIYQKNGFIPDGYTATVWQTERNETQWKSF